MAEQEFVDIADLQSEQEDSRPQADREFLTGPAGSGKTYTIQQRLAENWHDGGVALASTTGISAINLGPGVTTINSLLGYFDTQSLEEAYTAGQITRRLHKLQEEGVERLVIDEVSMMSAEQLEIILTALHETGRYKSEERGECPPISLTCTGDVTQLAPVPDKGKPAPRWCFEAHGWEHFHVNRLSKIWRQSDERFLSALAKMRLGKGGEAVEQLRAIPEIEWGNAKQVGFDGTTLVATNDEVGRFNRASLLRLGGAWFTLESERWGKQRGEWKIIPEKDELREGALVMLLANHYSDGDPSYRQLLYANGDLAHIVGWEDGEAAKQGEEDDAIFSPQVRGQKGVRVKLKRNGLEFVIGTVERRLESKEHPEKKTPKQVTQGYAWGEEWWDGEKGRFVLGAIRYYPLRAAYASTIYKSQGLSLDSVQLDLTNHFAGSPNMVYVATSRCRSASGLRIVGTPEMMSKRIKLDPKVAGWLEREESQ